MGFLGTFPQKCEKLQKTAKFGVYPKVIWLVYWFKNHSKPKKSLGRSFVHFYACKNVFFEKIAKIGGNSYFSAKTSKLGEIWILAWFRRVKKPINQKKIFLAIANYDKCSRKKFQEKTCIFENFRDKCLGGEGPSPPLTNERAFWRKNVRAVIPLYKWVIFY